MRSIAWASNEIRYRDVRCLRRRAACCGRVRVETGIRARTHRCTWPATATAVVGVALLSPLLVAHTGAAAAPPNESFAAAGRDATTALLRGFYAGAGLWRQCDAPDCPTGNEDWGDDALTYAIALRYRSTHEPRLRAILALLAASAPTYPAPCPDAVGCGSWSDVPEWDAVAAADEYLATGDRQALHKAEAAFAFVEGSRAYALGACPRIRYQQPGGGTNRLKTLETDANAIKAALLLYRATKQPHYLASARVHYAAVRAYFLDPTVPLYSVYVFDDGTTCTQLPHRFFASVNGDMIWSGAELARDTGERRYLTQALRTATAVAQRLADGRGIFADLQAENDVVEPLVEAINRLAQHRFARRWILRNAAAALSARTGTGLFGRFFDGPPPQTTVTAWQANGGAALEIAAAALAPRTHVAPAAGWSNASVVPDDVTGTTATIRVTGSGVALLGTLGEQCCESGHAEVVIDGRPTFDATGIWQNKSSSGRSIPHSVLFAWRWPRSGTHTISFGSPPPNGKEGGTFLHLTSYLELP